MTETVDIIKFGTEYIQFMAILLLGYSLYLLLNLKKEKWDYLEKTLTLFALGLIPFLGISIFRLLLHPESSNEIILIDTALISLLVSSVYISFHTIRKILKQDK